MWLPTIFLSFIALAAGPDTDSLSIPERFQIKAEAYRAATHYDIDYILVLAIIEVESGFNPRVTGATHNEVGLMQLRPKYFPQATFDIQNNIWIGVRYLREIYSRCYQKYRDAWFVCYNVGPNRRLKYPKLFPYYRKVMRAYARQHAIIAKRY